MHKTDYLEKSAEMVNDSLRSMPEDWKTHCLADLVWIDRFKLGENTAAGYSFKYIDISSIVDGRLQLSSDKIVFHSAPSRARKVVAPSDVLMSTVRPNLKAFVFIDRIDEPAVASTGFAVLSAKEGTDPRFVLYAILSDSISSQIDSLVVGSNYPAINSSDVSRLKILTPPPAEQSKISHILGGLDKLIDRTRSLIAKYNAIKQGMMQDLFFQGVDDNGPSAG